MGPFQDRDSAFLMANGQIHHEKSARKETFNNNTA